MTVSLRLSSYFVCEGVVCYVFFLAFFPFFPFSQSNEFRTFVHEYLKFVVAGVVSITTDMRMLWGNTVKEVFGIESLIGIFLNLGENAFWAISSHLRKY